MKLRFKYHIRLANPGLTKKSVTTVETNEKSASSNFIFYDEKSSVFESFDDMDAVIEKYDGLVTSLNFIDLFFTLESSSLYIFIILIIHLFFIR